MKLLEWLTAVVALFTALAMLKDTYLGEDVRGLLRLILRDAWAAFRVGGCRAIDAAELGAVVRFALRLVSLVGVVAGAGVAVVFPVLGDPVPMHEGVLRVSLCMFLALNVPCPWWRYINHGHPRIPCVSLRSVRRNAVH
ncbi:hypothetical protein [Lysobacter sp. CA199]|uniref:hypothetical protein n=1 Tax=Lysobacter sp. CA199 TaxID=3455608 RepID=UPI003F8D2924